MRSFSSLPHQFLHRLPLDPFVRVKDGFTVHEDRNRLGKSGTSMAMTHADVHEELVEQLDAHVREVVRREGVDPQRDAPVVRRIAESVVRDHDERSLTGVVAAVPDVEAVVGELVARVSGFGPLQPFLDDPAVEEVWINSLVKRSVAGQTPI